jgi:ketosteroid isomerase-like protein
MTSYETAQVMDRLFTALRAGDRATLETLFTPDVEWRQPRSTPDWDVSGREQVVERLGTGLVRDFFQRGTFKMKVERLMIDGNVAISEQSATAVTKAGEDYAMEYCWIYTLVDGQIAHIREYYDTHVAAHAFNWEE